MQFNTYEDFFAAYKKADPIKKAQMRMLLNSVYGMFPVNEPQVSRLFEKNLAQAVTKSAQDELNDIRKCMPPL